jgi:hypothetical protein
MFAAPSPATSRNNYPVLRSRVADKSGTSFFDTVNPAVPFVPSNDVLSPGRPASFGDRFGDWTSSDSGGPRVPYQPAPPGDGNSKRGDADGIPVLRSRLVSRDGAGNASLIPVGLPSEPAPLSQAGRPLGIFSGEPMPDYPVPLPIWGFPDKSASASDEGEDSLNRLIRLLVRK